MKLAYVDLSRPIELDYQKATEWVIESPELFVQYTQMLYQQMEGAEGEFILSENDEILDFSKQAEIILNPFGLDFNDRRIQKKLYSELQKAAYGENAFLDTGFASASSKSSSAPKKFRLLISSRRRSSVSSSISDSSIRLWKKSTFPILI